MKRKKILLVDDEDTILLGLHRKLYSLNSECDVMLASSGEVAQQILSEQSIDVMVTDVRMPGISGLDLLAWAAVHSPKTRVIIITAFDVAQLQDQATRQGCLQIVQKPFDLNKMRDMIQGLLDDEGSLGGNLGSLSTADVIQMLCLSHRTTALRVVEGSRVGMIHIIKGEIVHATWNGKVGEEAVYHILQATQGVFNTLPLMDFDTCTVNSGWQQLLLEGMRLADEGVLDHDEQEEKTEEMLDRLVYEEKRDVVAKRIKGVKSKAKLDKPTSAKGKKEQALEGMKELDRKELTGSLKAGIDQNEDFSALVDKGFEHLRRKEYLGAKDTWEQALMMEPGNRMLELNLKKLDKLMEQASS